MLTTLLIVAGLSNVGSLLGVLGYRMRNRKLKKEIERLKIDNEESKDAVIDVLTNHITDDHVRQYLKAVNAADHSWQLIAEADMKWDKHQNTKTDTLITEKCKHCGMMHRYWERGLGTIEQPAASGFWMDEEKLDGNDYRKFECQSVAAKRKIPLLLSSSEEAECQTNEKSSKLTSKNAKK